MAGCLEFEANPFELAAWFCSTPHPDTGDMPRPTISSVSSQTCTAGVSLFRPWTPLPGVHPQTEAKKKAAGMQDDSIESAKRRERTLYA